MKRRNFIQQLIGGLLSREAIAAVGLTLGADRCAPGDGARQDLWRDALARLDDPQVTVRAPFGRARVDVPLPLVSAGYLDELLAPALALSERADYARAADVIRAELLAGDVVLVRGWILSRSEASLCALAYVAETL